MFSDIQGKGKTGLRFTLQVAGLPDNTFVVVGFTLHEQYSSLFRLELELASANPAVEFVKVLDSSVTLTIWREAEVERTVNGIAVSMEQGDTGFRRTRYQLSVRPALWRAGLKRNSRIFQQQAVPDIVETLLREQRITDYAFGLGKGHEVREFCVQYQEDNLAFIERLCAEEGIFYFFEHSETGHKLVFADHFSMQIRGPELPYNPAMNAQLQELCIHTLRRRESIRVSEVELKDYTFINPLWEAEYRDYARDMNHQPRSYSSYDYPGRYKDDAPGKNFARWRVDGLSNDAHQGEGAANCAALFSGSNFTLTDHPRDEMNIGWQITAITHSGKQPQALEEEAGEQGTTLSNTFTFIPHNQTWRPQVLDKPKIDGAQIAIVTGPEGEEIYCDEYGRVRVRFLWDRSGITDDTSSCWIRVSQPWAGQQWGGLSIPRVGHEVIVEFLNGDPDQPVIIGRTYHAVNIPPGKLPAEKTHSTLKSKEYKGSGYNEVLLDDTADNVRTQIHSTPGSSQLNLGFIRHPRGKEDRERGKGFELRTDEHGAIRAGKGIYLSANERNRAESKQLDLKEAIEQLEFALNLAKSLAGAATPARVKKTDIQNQQQQLDQVYRTLAKPGILASAPEGIALVTPKTAQISAQDNLTFTSGEHTDIIAQKDLRVAAGKGINLFTVEDEIKLAANKGKIQIEAQNNNIEIYANNNLKILSNNDRVEIAAQKEILLTSGEAYIKIANGNILIHAPGMIENKAASHPHSGPASMNYNFRSYDPGNDEMFVIKDDEGNPVPNYGYKIIREDGEVFRGVTNADGETLRVQTGENKLKLNLYEDDGSVLG